MINQDYDRVKQRYTDFWNRENHDRPLICAWASMENPKPYPTAPESLKDRWEDAEYVIANARRGMENTYFGGEALPVFNPNLGPDIVGACAGCEIEYGEGTSWALHCVEDWDTFPPIRFDVNNRWWKKIEEITRAAVADANGDYLVGITDLHPGTDGLVSLRGPEELCCDLVDHAEAVNPRIDELFEIHKEIYKRLNAVIAPHQEGTTNWMGIWHPHKRWYVVGSDFSCMISADAYERFIVSGLQKEIDFVDGSIYHLDGPGALRHVDRILALPGLDGIQWVPGAGQPHGTHWLGLYQTLQNAGKLLQIYCDKNDVETLCKSLRPEGVQIIVDGCRDKAEIDDLIALALRASKKEK
jgi:hypothetical protein